MCSADSEDCDRKQQMPIVSYSDANSSLHGHYPIPDDFTDEAALSNYYEGVYPVTASFTTRSAPTDTSIVGETTVTSTTSLTSMSTTHIPTTGVSSPASTSIEAGNRPQAVRVGVGVGLGALCAVLISAMMFYFLRRHKHKTLPQYGTSPPETENSHHSSNILLDSGKTDTSHELECSVVRQELDGLAEVQELDAEAVRSIQPKDDKDAMSFHTAHSICNSSPRSDELFML